MYNINYSSIASIFNLRSTLFIGHHFVPGSGQGTRGRFPELFFTVFLFQGFFPNTYQLLTIRKFKLNTPKNKII